MGGKTSRSVEKKHKRTSWLGKGIADKKEVEFKQSREQDGEWLGEESLKITIQKEGSLKVVYVSESEEGKRKEKVKTTVEEVAEDPDFWVELGLSEDFVESVEEKWEDVTDFDNDRIEKQLEKGGIR